MQQVPVSLDIAIVLISALTVYLFYRATNKSKYFLFIIIPWMALQLLIGSTDFYTRNATTPPRFALMIIPPLILITLLFATKAGRKFIDNADIKQLTILHAIRIPVEIVLYYLFLAKTIPGIMTFEGRNFDVISGVSAIVVYYLVFVNSKFSYKLLLGWNVLGLMLLANIVGIAVLSLQTPFQRFGFGQPNVALAHFPFNWLPSVIVPVVLLSHLISLRQIIMYGKKSALISVR